MLRYPFSNSPVMSRDLNEIVFIYSKIRIKQSLKISDQCCLVVLRPISLIIIGGRIPSHSLQPEIERKVTVTSEKIPATSYYLKVTSYKLLQRNPLNGIMVNRFIRLMGSFFSRYSRPVWNSYLSAFG